MGTMYTVGIKFFKLSPEEKSTLFRVRRALGARQNEVVRVAIRLLGATYNVDPEGVQRLHKAITTRRRKPKGPVVVQGPPPAI